MEGDSPWKGREAGLLTFPVNSCHPDPWWPRNPGGTDNAYHIFPVQRLSLPELAPFPLATQAASSHLIQSPEASAGTLSLCPSRSLSGTSSAEAISPAPDLRGSGPKSLPAKVPSTSRPAGCLPHGFIFDLPNQPLGHSWLPGSGFACSVHLGPTHVPDNPDLGSKKLSLWARGAEHTLGSQGDM